MIEIKLIKNDANYLILWVANPLLHVGSAENYPDLVLRPSLSFFPSRAFLSVLVLRYGFDEIF